jgi:hypothetical protein
MIRRRDFLGSLSMMATLPLRGWAAGFPGQQPPGALFPCPLRDAECQLNPPGFAWWRAEGAAAYRMSIRDERGRTIYESARLDEPVHTPNRTFPPGICSWDVLALDGADAVLARRGWWQFRIPPEVPELPWEDPKTLLARVPSAHPRYVFPAPELARVRASLTGGRQRAWQELRRQAEAALNVPLPEQPRYHTFTGQNRARMGYVEYFREFRRRVDGPLGSLSLDYLLSGEERFGLRAKRLLLEIESWGIEGPMSVLSPFGDEPGLSMARYGPRAYDWLYPLLDESERRRARDMTIGRARQVLERLRRARYLTTPSESHNGRLIAYLGEHALVIRDEAPDTPEWLDYSLRALTTFYPHWGGFDGGWAEGISYAISYNTLYLGAIESLRAAAGIDLYKRPFFRNIRRFFLYCTSPVGEIRPFGDGAETGGVGSQGAALMLHHGRRFKDPACVWWANRTGESPGGDSLIPLLTEDEVKEAPPSAMPQSAAFRGVGWAGLHSALDDPAADTFLLFKSSPYGSVSHSHADQNSFALLKGGRALAIPSGHYGPAYGMPHHAEWTRQTKANNCILVNGAGQEVRSANARGRIVDFQDGKVFSYVSGDAAAAYAGKLNRFLRHVLFLRPGVILILDELAAPGPAAYSWLLHGFEQMTADEQRQVVVSRRGGAHLEAWLAGEGGMNFSQTDRFDTDYNEGNPVESRREVPNHWHFTGRTREVTGEFRIGAVLVVRGAGDSFEVRRREMPGWLGVQLESSNGSGEAWLQLRAGTRGPEFARGGRIAARWRPRTGPVDSLVPA